MSIDRELILQCLDKNLTAQKKLYCILAPVMQAACHRYAATESEAEDILQTGFLKLFTNLHQYRFEGPVEGWARRIIVNTAINHAKRQSWFNRDVDVEQLAYDNRLCENFASGLSASDLQELIRDMQPRYWQVFKLHEIEGYDHKEIGAILGICEGTSKSLLHRARASIRKRLKGYGIG